MKQVEFMNSIDKIITREIIIKASCGDKESMRIIFDNTRDEIYKGVVILLNGDEKIAIRILEDTYIDVFKKLKSDCTLEMLRKHLKDKSISYVLKWRNENNIDNKSQ